MFMWKWQKRTFIIFTCLFFVTAVLELDALARVGGGGSFGSRGSQSFSAPSRSYYTPSPSRPPGASQTAPSSPMSPQMPQSRPSMWKTFAMGALGGLVGGMLFGGLGHGGLGGSGLGLVEILLIGGLVYLIYRFFMKRKQAESPGAAYYQTGSVTPVEDRTNYAPAYQEQGYSESNVQAGIGYIRQMDPSFDEKRFTDLCMDFFFKIQGAWANRDMASVRTILTEQMFGILQGDAEKLKAEKKINKLDNIAVRSVEIAEVWQEEGKDFITVRFLANLLDYTVGESGELLSGSKTEPVKFEEYWTFTRPVGNNPWQLSAITQSE